MAGGCIVHGHPIARIGQRGAYSAARNISQMPLQRDGSCAICLACARGRRSRLQEALACASKRFSLTSVRGANWTITRQTRQVNFTVEFVPINFMNQCRLRNVDSEFLGLPFFTEAFWWVRGVRRLMPLETPMNS